MRRLVLLGLCVMLVATACATPGSAPGAPGSPPGTPEGSTPGTTSPTAPGGTRDADIYTAVLRRYLTHPSENSFPGFTFPTVYVLSRTDPQAAEPIEPPGSSPGAAIPVGDQERIVAALRDVGNIQFIDDPSEVIVNSESCAQVRDGGILIVLAPPKGDADRVEVGTHGFVACLGATWLTYVVERETNGWIVTGTTGPMAVA